MQAKVIAAAVVAVALVSGGVSGGLAWTYQGNRWGAKVTKLEKAHQDAILLATVEANQRYINMENRKDEAIKTRDKELEANRAAAAAAKRAADGMRKQLRDAEASFATATQAALAEYATAQGELLGICTEEYQRMADKAQGHATDVRTLINAWPKVEGTKE